MKKHDSELQNKYLKHLIKTPYIRNILIRINKSMDSVQRPWGSATAPLIGKNVEKRAGQLVKFPSFLRVQSCIHPKQEGREKKDRGLDIFCLELTPYWRQFGTWDVFPQHKEKERSLPQKFIFMQRLKTFFRSEWIKPDRTRGSFEPCARAFLTPKDCLALKVRDPLKHLVPQFWTHFGQVLWMIYISDIRLNW